MQENINTTCHRLLKEYLNSTMIAIDGTAGNGNDTLFLCQHCHHVYAFDIQPQAKQNTLERCQKMINLTFILDSHEFIDKYVNEPIDVALFNFGYLPKADSSIITQPASSLKAIQAAYVLLKPTGRLMLACYIGHAGGQEEHEQIYAWLMKNQITFTQYRTDKPLSPILYECIK